MAAQAVDSDAASIDLTNKKSDINEVLDIHSANKLFSKTATNDLLKGANGTGEKLSMLVEDGASASGGAIVVTNLLDSQTSSPTMKREYVESIVPITSSRVTTSNNPNNRSSKQQPS